MSKEIKIYALDKSNFKDLKSDKLEIDMTTKLKQINMGNTFFIKAYMEYKNVSDIEFTDDIVKLFIPSKRVETLLLDGFYMNGHRYIAYTSTPSLQKKEDVGHKTEFIFIKEEEKKFIGWFQCAISLGKFKEKYSNNTKPIAINKKITSRTALAFSNVTKINCFEPRIIIVKNSEYTHLTNVDIIETTGKGNKRKIVLENGKPKLLLNQQVAIKHEAHDGMGLMSPLMAQVIKESMELEYDVYFAVIRGFMGLAIKGMCMTFDYVSYFEEYNQHSTGKYGCYTVIDAYGVEQDIRQCDLLLTTSQAKWWENFKKQDDNELFGMKEVYNQLSKIKHQSKRDMLSALYITKVNKDPSKLNTHTMSNYQLIGNLDITLSQYKELAKETQQLYKGVLDGNMDAIKIFLKEFTELSTYINEDGEEVVEEAIQDDKIQPSTIAEALLNFDSDFYKLKSVKRTLRALVRQKIYNLMSGRCMIRGVYTYLAQDPIALLNSLIGNVQEGELKDNEFYCNGVEKDYVIQRNPCNCFSEIVKIHTTTNDIYDKWLGHVGREMVIFNAKDSTNTRLSGADFDGDAGLLTDSEIILDTVIDSDTFFYNEADGETETMVYNRTNRMKALYNTGGNSIGTYALVGAKLSNDSYDDHLKHLPYLYTTLLMQMIAIDSVKSMISVPEQMKEVLKCDHVKKIKKPYFMKYRNYVKGTQIFDKDDYIHVDYVKSTLDKYAKYCIGQLISPYRGEVDGDSSSKLILSKMAIPACGANMEIVKELTDIYEEKVKRLADLKVKFETEGKSGELVEEKKMYKAEADKHYRNAKMLKEELECESHVMDSGAIEHYGHQIYEAKKHNKESWESFNTTCKELKPFYELNKIDKAEINADIQLKCSALIEKHGKDAVVRALHTKRYETTHYHTPSFITNNFFDLIAEYMVVTNAYKLEKVKKNGDFTYLEQEYKRVEMGIADSHIVAQKIISNLNKVSKSKGLGKSSGKWSLGLVDQTMRSLSDYNYLKGTLKLEVDETGKVWVHYNDERVGSFFNNNCKNVNLQEVEEIEIFDIELPKKYTGKSIYIYFKM